MVIINVGTNDSNSNCLRNKIANDVVNLATVKNEIQSEKAMIVSRNDQFEKIVNEVNEAVKELCVSKNLSCIDCRWKCKVLPQLYPVEKLHFLPHFLIKKFKVFYIEFVTLHILNFIG